VNWNDWTCVDRVCHRLNHWMWNHRRWRTHEVVDPPRARPDRDFRAVCVTIRPAPAVVVAVVRPASSPSSPVSAAMTAMTMTATAMPTVAVTAVATAATNNILSGSVRVHLITRAPCAGRALRGRAARAALISCRKSDRGGSHQAREERLTFRIGADIRDDDLDVHRGLSRLERDEAIDRGRPEHVSRHATCL
jgi:hypothetical protein